MPCTRSASCIARTTSTCTWLPRRGRRPFVPATSPHGGLMNIRWPAALVIAVALVGGCVTPRQAGHVLDEARQAGRSAESMPAADEDYFKDMDGAVSLSPAEIQGRNTWMVWTGGNDRLWDVLSRTSVGNLDLLKVLSSHP